MAKEFLELESGEWLNVRCVCFIGNVAAGKVSVEQDNGKRCLVTENDAKKIKKCLRREKRLIKITLGLLLVFSGVIGYSLKPEPTPVKITYSGQQCLVQEIVPE